MKNSLSRSNPSARSRILPGQKRFAALAAMPVGHRPRACLSPQYSGWFEAAIDGVAANPLTQRTGGIAVGSGRHSSDPLGLDARAGGRGTVVAGGLRLDAVSSVAGYYRRRQP